MWKKLLGVLLFVVFSQLQAIAASVLLQWNASTDNVGVAGYNIYRNGVKIGSSTTTSFTDTGLDPNTSYTYAVTAFDAAGNESGQSTAVNVTTLASSGSGAEKPGPSAVLYNAQTYYTCLSNRYVSTTGNAGNNGLTIGTPWDIQTASSQSLPAGTCINVATGVYSVDEVDIQFGGTDASKTGYIVWRCSSMPFSFSNGVLQGEGTGCVIRTLATSFYSLRFRSGISYVMLDGFEFDGSVMGVNSTVCVDSETPAAPINHHIWIFNSDIHGCGQSGIQWNFADWLFVIHNVWHDNSTQNCVMGSGLSMWQPTGLASYSPVPGNPDYWHSATENLTYHIVINYNVGYHNFNPQGPCGATANTDGEGIILDTWSHEGNACLAGTVCPTTFPTLVMGNIMYNNGGNGIQIFGDSDTTTAPKTIVNNTVFSNNWDTFNNGTFRAGASSSASKNNKWINNIAVAVRGAGVTAGNQPFMGEQINRSCPTGNTWGHNLSAPAGENLFDGGSCNTYPIPTNVDTSTASFVNASTATPNFALQSGSLAIGMGQVFDLWQQSVTVDAGACPFNSPGPVTNCP